NFYILGTPQISQFWILPQARQIRIDDINGQSSLQHVIQRRQRTCQHWGMVFPCTNSCDKIDIVCERCNTGCKSKHLLTNCIGCRQQDFAITQSVRSLGYVLTMFKIASPTMIQYAQIFGITSDNIVKPGYFGNSLLGSNGNGYDLV